MAIAAAADMVAADFAGMPSVDLTAEVAIAGSAAAAVGLAGLLAEKFVDLAAVAALAVLPVEPFVGQAAVIQ